MVLDHYGRYCACCKESTEFFLSVDHVNNDGYLDKDSNGRRVNGGRLYRKIVVADYPETYQILCMNCNYGKMMNNGICPHTVVKV